MKHSLWFPLGSVIACLPHRSQVGAPLTDQAQDAGSLELRQVPQRQGHGRRHVPRPLRGDPAGAPELVARRRLEARMPGWRGFGGGPVGTTSILDIHIELGLESGVIYSASNEQSSKAAKGVLSSPQWFHPQGRQQAVIFGGMDIIGVLF